MSTWTGGAAEQARQRQGGGKKSKATRQKVASIVTTADKEFAHEWDERPFAVHIGFKTSRALDAFKADLTRRLPGVAITTEGDKFDQEEWDTSLKAGLDKKGNPEATRYTVVVAGRNGVAAVRESAKVARMTQARLGDVSPLSYITEVDDHSAWVPELKQEADDTPRDLRF